MADVADTVGDGWDRVEGAKVGVGEGADVPRDGHRRRLGEAELYGWVEQLV